MRADKIRTEIPRLIPISNRMKSNAKGFKDDASKKYGHLTKPATKTEQGQIEVGFAYGLEVLYCFQAIKHRDYEFAWSAIWPVVSHGHVMHAQENTVSEVVDLPMTPDNVILFHALNYKHWTTKGKGILIISNMEFGDTCPTDEEVLAQFDKKLTDL